MPEAREIDARRVLSPSVPAAHLLEHRPARAPRGKVRRNFRTLFDNYRIQWTEVLFLVVSQPLYDLNGTPLSIGWCILILTMEYRVPLVQPTKTRYRHAMLLPPQMQLSLV